MWSAAAVLSPLLILAQRAVPQVLSACSTMDLNYVLLNVNTAALVEVSGRHTMEMLTSPQQRLPELRIVTRCL